MNFSMHIYDFLRKEDEFISGCGWLWLSPSFRISERDIGLCPSHTTNFAISFNKMCCKKLQKILHPSPTQEHNFVFKLQIIINTGKIIA